MDLQWFGTVKTLHNCRSITEHETLRDELRVTRSKLNDLRSQYQQIVNSEKQCKNDLLQLQMKQAETEAK